MSHVQSTFRRWFLLPAVLVGLHTLLVVTAAAVGGFGYDRSGHAFISGPMWVLFCILDFPDSWLLLKQSSLEPSVFFLCLGIIHWGLIGLVVQVGWRWLRREKADA